MSSLTRSLHVLEAVAEHQPVGVGALSRLLGQPKSTVQRTLVTLAEAGWVRGGGETTRWTLGARAMTIGRRTTSEVRLREAALEPMRRLNEATREAVHFTVPDGDRGMVVIDRLDSDQPVRTFISIGATTSLTASSTGRAVLAHRTDDEIAPLVARGLERCTARTVTDPDAWWRELQLTRTRGYAVNLGENRDNVCAVAAAVLDPGEAAVAGICISVPDVRFTSARIPDWGEQVRGAARVIMANLRR
ncbi:MAG: helix-turn-helix domain-containing protein [Streptosporangiales bacterium]|nr:helix-turn-helix domain-containing protein [Streptosporangiales bacterium]